MTGREIGIVSAVVGQFFLGYALSRLRKQPLLTTRKQFAALVKKSAGEGYVIRVFVAFDIFCNVVAGGQEDETISSRVRRVTDAHPGLSWNPGVWLAKVINGWLSFISPDHGQHAQTGDLERAEAVDKIEGTALDVQKIESENP